MKTLLFEQFLPVTLDEAWLFFSSPSNLDVITPPQMRFEVLSNIPDQIEKDLIIRYRIQPMMRIGMRWVTRITDLEDKVFFIDEQTSGPYKVWRHEHRFKEVEGGVVVTDKLTYDIGLGPLGWLAGKLWVDGQVRRIFEFRKKKLQELFGPLTP